MGLVESRWVPAQGGGLYRFSERQGAIRRSETAETRRLAPYLASRRRSYVLMQSSDPTLTRTSAPLTSAHYKHTSQHAPRDEPTASTWLQFKQNLSGLEYPAHHAECDGDVVV